MQQIQISIADRLSTVGFKLTLQSYREFMSLLIRTEQHIEYSRLYNFEIVQGIYLSILISKN